MTACPAGYAITLTRMQATDGNTSGTKVGLVGQWRNTLTRTQATDRNIGAVGRVGQLGPLG